jgi:poly(glycerol-phosphate) alpha-glucosyltransferase
MIVEPMNLAVVTPFLSRNGGGVSQVVRDISSELCRQGLALEVLCLEDEHVDADCAGVSFPYRTFSGRGPSGFGYSPGMREALGRSDAQLFHVHDMWMYPAAAAGSVGRRRNIPRIVSPHGTLDRWALGNSRWKKRCAAHLFANKNLRTAACIHALCGSEYESARNYGLTNPVAVIPNGIELPSGDNSGPAPWSDVIGGDRDVMLFLGRIHPKKGLPELVRAWAKLKGEQRGASKKWALVIAGWSQGGHEDELRSLAHAGGIADEIVFLGPVFGERKTAALRHAKAFILPSYSEGLPMSVLEAWAHGLPVVMTAECNLPEGFAAGAACEIRPEAASIAEKCAEFFALSPEAQQQIGLNGRSLVERRFTWTKIAGEMIEVYKWILGGGERPDCVRVD